MPEIMVTRVMRGDDTAQRRQRQRSLAIDSDAPDATLLPGQTRIWRAENPKHTGEIKGDSESSGDERSSVEESYIKDVSPRTLSGIRSRKHSSEQTIELTDTSDDSESSSSDDGVDDEDIQMFLDPYKRRTSNGHRGVREESLIDWMLAKTRTVGTLRKPSVRDKSSDRQRRTKVRSKHKVNKTRGSRRLGAERQTTLNFRNRSDKNYFPPRDDGPASRTLGSSTSGGGLEDDDYSRDLDTNLRVMQDYNMSKQRARKIKAKERRSRAKTNGLYTFVSGDTHAVTGGRKPMMVSVNLEDEDFHVALAPSSQKHERMPRSFTHLHLDEQLGHSHTGDSSINDANAQRIFMLKPGVHRDVHHDSVLHSGLSFGQDTYTRRGWLYDLVREVSSPADVTVPVAFTFRGEELGLATSTEKVCDSLKVIINHFFDLACDLPELDREPADKDLGMVAHLLCKLLSWFLTRSVDDRNFVLKAVQDQISQSLARLREIFSLDAPLDTSSLSICWMMVELSARIGHFLKESVSWLLHNLLEYGLLQTMIAVREDNILDGSTTAQYTAELWVRLFHLLDHYPSKITEKPCSHMFWGVVMEYLESAKPSKRSLESSESTWRTIFSLCALTQFSVHGMTTTTSRLPACWELVVLALKTIRLAADPQVDQELSVHSIDKRDEYLGLITLRCFRLWNCWHWTLDGAYILFNQLVDIFRSRKFANLRHEVADFPAFMLKGDWDLLSNYRHGDTAFELFLKLMFQATSNDMTNPNRTISPTARKLLSLAIPVGSLPFSKNSVTRVQDLSMLFNRLSAVAIGIYLDPDNHLSRITHARTYVNFFDADDNTRLAVMRGMMNLGILMKNRNVPLDGIAGWAKEMADVLADEFKAIPKTIALAENHLRVRKDRLVFSVQCLLGCVRRIVEAYKNTSQYPEPALLSKLA
jgi:Mus7/MMS22 family